MKLGASLGYFGVGTTVAQTAQSVAAAERLGYASIWVGEPYGNDGPSVMGWIAAQTSRIRIGSSILAIPGRTATMTAQTAATLDLLSDGRLILGLGTSGPQVAEGWHGQPFANQLRRTREYVEVVRMALRREVVAYDGETITLPRPGGEGKALKLILEPPRADVPIYLAAMGPKNTELCGEIADGWLPLWFAPEHAEELGAPLAIGAERAGRDPGEIAVCPAVTALVTDDETAALNLMRPMLALYVGGMGSRRRNFYNALIRRYGYEREAAAVQDLYLAGNKAEAAAALPEDLLRMLCLVGSVDAVAERMRAWADAGVDTLIVIPAAVGGAASEQLELLAEAARASGVVELEAAVAA